MSEQIRPCLPPEPLVPVSHCLLLLMLLLHPAVLLLLLPLRALARQQV